MRDSSHHPDTEMVTFSRRRITGAVVLLGLIAILAGIVPRWVAPPEAFATALTIQVGDDTSAFFAMPRTGTRPMAAGLTLRPPMGWNGFNHFYHDVTESRVEATAQALITSGMKAAGYAYVNLDGGWDLRRRDFRGNLQPDPRKFPHGMRAVADYVHSLGLKFGIYTSAGLENCAGTSAGSYGHFRQDAAAFASWGVDYLKLDYCFIPYHDYPRMNRKQISRMLARDMADALAVTGRAIVFDVNDLTNDEPWSSAPGRANLWRTTPDIQDRYSSMLWNFTRNVKHYAHAGPGGWNDPDMLEVGNGGMTISEYRSQFSLWAEMAAPLIAGNDLTTMSPATQSILTNRAVIAVDQDPLGRQGYPVTSSGGHWVLTKPLADGHRAVLLFNQTNSPATISATTAQVGLGSAAEYAMLDLWTGTASETTGVISAVVPAHGSVFYDISESSIPPFIS